MGRAKLILFFLLLSVCSFAQTNNRNPLYKHGIVVKDTTYIVNATDTCMIYIYQDTTRIISTTAYFKFSPALSNLSGGGGGSTDSSIYATHFYVNTTDSVGTLIKGSIGSGFTNIDSSHTANTVTKIFRKTASDSVFVSKNGTVSFAFKDSIGTSSTVDTSAGNPHLATQYYVKNTDSVGTLVNGIWHATAIDSTYLNNVSDVGSDSNTFVRTAGKKKFVGVSTNSAHRFTTDAEKSHWDSSYVVTYTPITAADASSAETFGWVGVSNGTRYKITDWTSNATNIVAVYSEIFTNNSGDKVLRSENRDAEIDCGLGNIYQCKVDFKLDGARIKRVNLQNGFDQEITEISLPLDFATVFPFGNIAWLYDHISDLEIDFNGHSDCVLYGVHADYLYVSFSDDGQQINQLTGFAQSVYFTGAANQFLQGCVVGSNQVVHVSQSYSFVDFSKHYLKYVADYSQSSTSDPVNAGVAPQSDIQDVLQMTRTATGQYNYSNIVGFDPDLLQADGSTISITKIHGAPQSDWDHLASGSKIYTYNPLTAFTQSDDLMNYTIEFHIQIK